MLFRNALIQAELEQNGFVIIPFLNHIELDYLNNFYKEAHPNADPPLFIENIHMTTWCEDAVYKERIATGLMHIFKDATDRFFKNYRRLNNVFIVKKSGQQTNFKVHQDWNVVDETKYQSVNVWIPLHDVDEQTGALWVLKGSHKLNRPVRGAGYLFPEYGQFSELLEKNADSVKLKAGEAIVFYHSIIHGSPPNLSTEQRRAACFSVIPKEAPLCIYFQPKAQMPLEQYEPDDDFIFKYDYLRTETLHKPPAEKAVKVLASYVNQKVELKELNVFLKKRRNFFSFWK